MLVQLPEGCYPERGWINPRYVSEVKLIGICRLDHEPTEFILKIRMATHPDHYYNWVIEGSFEDAGRRREELVAMFNAASQGGD